MKLRSLAMAALGLGLAMAVPAAAYAYTSYTTDPVNFRAGPGVGYHSYGALPPGTPVNVSLLPARLVSRVEHSSAPAGYRRAT